MHNPTQYVYRRTEPQLFTVGFYDPEGKWHTDSDHDDREQARLTVNYLNGGTGIHDIPRKIASLHRRLEQIEAHFPDEVQQALDQAVEDGLLVRVEAK